MAITPNEAQFLALAERNSHFTLLIEEAAHDHSEE